MPSVFRISAAHMDAFSKQQLKRFEDEMVVHLQTEYPEESVKMGEEGLREVIREGIRASESYGMVLEPDVARYIELMLAISPDFDQSKKTPWAREILMDKRLTAQQKLEGIYQRIVFGGAAGPEEAR